MIRKIIKIDEEKCNGCGACAAACHEGAIAMVEGKAKLMREDYCDGLGDCLPACPTGAITFEEREAPAYDHEAVLASKAAGRKETNTAGGGEKNGAGPNWTGEHSGCPGSRAMAIRNAQTAESPENTASCPSGHSGGHTRAESQLAQWPVQIKLAPVKTGYFEGANLLIAADCTAYAYGDFHDRFMRGKVTLIGCPKLDEADYSEKLKEIISQNDIRSLTIVRMEVPCCGGIEAAAKSALKESGKFIPWQVVTISTDGKILE